MRASRAEVCVTACSDAWRGSGEVLAHAVGVIPMISARLAKLTHSPDLVITDGSVFLMSEAPPLGRTAAAGGVTEGWLPFRKVFAVLETGRRHSLMGASQIDVFGNQNISSIGDWRKPTRQLIGMRGAPGNTVNHRTDYWVPRQSARIFVPAVDVVSGVGNDRARSSDNPALRFHDLGFVLTDLAVFDYDDDGRLRLRSRHPGVSHDELRSKVGVDIDLSADAVTREPDEEELRLIREVIDPAGARNSEVPEPVS